MKREHGFNIRPADLQSLWKIQVVINNHSKGNRHRFSC